MAFSSTELLAFQHLLKLALEEDLGSVGDRTSLATIAPQQHATAAVVIRAPGVLAGLETVVLTCQAVNPALSVEVRANDGDAVSKGQIVARVSGPLQSILSAERTLLNFMQHLAGVATLTNKFVTAIHGFPAKILDTRKTLPGWRLLDKYAVRMGGGTNHRIGLYDAILIKDNHIAGLASDPHPVRKAVELARAYPGNAGLPVEVEVDSLRQLEQVLPIRPEIVLLDNMTNDDMRAAVMICNKLSPSTLLEASGGVNLQTVRAIAETGVDRISIGAITHSAPALDIALDFQS
jgi:nicotinate-nucleotide pyrophosphorylase (carboxylating)